jgi:hypothetical protein
VKLRPWAILIALLGLFLLAGGLDRAGPGSQGLGASETATAASEYLTACQPSQPAYEGPLVPYQATPQPVLPLENLQPEAAIQPSSWSARAGFSISYSTDPFYWAQLLGSGWYLDWSVQAEALKNGPEHWQMVRVHQDCISPSPQTIREAATNLPGQVWIIGNEPDVIWQDNVTPARYAEQYHALYRLIKASDPTAKVAVGGIAQATPLRLQYLDQVLDTYQKLYHASLPADWWTVHGYVLREEQGSWGVEIPPGLDVTQGELYEVSDHGRLDLFESQLVAFRQWMKANGYQETPLALTEFGILMPNSYGFPPESIANYLYQTFTWLYNTRDEIIGYPDDVNHLVQKWAWFSISDPNYSSSDLGDLSTGQLTLAGERFRTVVSTKGY